jgi:aldehyde:ferredoxin oxidoreductase
VDRARLRGIAAQVTNAARRFNIREGVTRAADSLPKRFYEEALGKDRKRISEEDLCVMLDEYYGSRGWNPEGIPPPLPDV